ncbi:hypothetical protein GCM10022268_17420 [Sphingomonas cynarae]|uniref:Uncharacterized protein n=1 Tax=Sphingomonas cynarae TaxID=930197 RepID=A0ABP7DTB6_9SPHN
MIAALVAKLGGAGAAIKIGLVALLVVWGLRVDQLRGRYKADLAACEAGRALDQAHGERDVAQATAGFAIAGAAAAQTYADRLAARAPLIIKSTDTVREYAQTDAGRVPCRDPERVRAIDDLDAAIAADPGAAGGRAGGLHPDPAAPPAGR